MNIELTNDERNLLSTIASSKEHKITSIEKSSTEFRVHYTLYGGVGSQAIVYNLAAAIRETIADIRKAEALRKKIG